MTAELQKIDLEQKYEERMFFFEGRVVFNFSLIKEITQFKSLPFFIL